MKAHFFQIPLIQRIAHKLMKKSDDHGIIINIGSVAGHNASFEFPLNVYAGIINYLKDLLLTFSRIT